MRRWPACRRSAETEPEIWMFRGQAKERDGNWQAAAEDYRKALELNPNLNNAHYRLSMIEERQGRREQAAAHRKRWQELREARTRLPQAAQEYQAALAAASGPEPDHRPSPTCGPPAGAWLPSARPSAGPAPRRPSTRWRRVCELLSFQFSVSSESSVIRRRKRQQPAGSGHAFR